MSREPNTLPGNDLLTTSDRIGHRDLNSTMELIVKTSARNIRAAYQSQVQLARCRLTDVKDADGKVIKRSEHSFRDSVGIQLLKLLSDDIEALDQMELGPDETELMRSDRKARLRAQQTKILADMQAAQAKVLDRSARGQAEAAKLQFQMRAHVDKMRAQNPDWDAKSVEEAADG